MAKSAVFKALLFWVECPECGASIMNPLTDSYDWEPADLHRLQRAQKSVVDCEECLKVIPIGRKTAEV